MIRRFSTQPSPSKRSIPTFLIIGWAVFCILVGISLIRSSLQVKDAFSARDKAKEALRVEEEKNQQLKQQLQEADDPLSQEKMIRDQLNMQKPGENVLLLPSPTP